MNHTGIFPYYYPTTALFLDDNLRFLEHFSFSFPTGLSFRLFDSPLGALRHLDEVQESTPLCERCFFGNQETIGHSDLEQVMRLDLSVLYTQLFNPDRFSEVSVVVVDYDMPEMNGLDFCRSIVNPAIKKILFTGKADERIAVQAFNEGIIDRFVLKSDSNPAATVIRNIKELESLYFRDVSKLISKTLSIDSPYFLDDPLFAAFIVRLCAQERFIEYYLTTNPQGLLLADDHGRTAHLTIQTADDLDTHYEIAQVAGAPEELLDGLRGHLLIPDFWRAESYAEDGYRHWKQYVLPAQAVRGSHGLYYYALQHNPPSFEISPDSVIGYQAFLQSAFQG
ncbi:MAG: response regulator [Chromatiales bacterium]|nr:response regulator [Chromatiales bacterium]